MSKLMNYVSKLVEFMKLPEGDNDVRLVSYHISDSFHNSDGSLKAELPAYKNPAGQLILTFIGLANNGGITVRLNDTGFRKYAKLSDDEIASGKYTDVNGYACTVDTQSGKLVRVESEENTRTCENILDQFFASCQIPEGSGIDALDAVIANKTPIRVTVVNDPYEERDQLRISKFRKIADVKADVPSDMEA